MAVQWLSVFSMSDSYNLKDLSSNRSLATGLCVLEKGILLDLFHSTQLEFKVASEQNNMLAMHYPLV